MAEPGPEPVEAELRAFHARRAGESDRVFGPSVGPDGRSSYTWIVDDLAGTELGAVASSGRGRVRVLDVGCGDGAVGRRLLERWGEGIALTGLDMSAHELAEARRRVRGSFVEGRAQAMPFADAAFDAVVSHMALMLMLPIEPVIAELTRVLRPGGRLSVVVGGKPGPRGVVQAGFFDALRSAQTDADRAFRWGDGRTRDEDGWRGLLGSAFTGLVVTPFQLALDVPTERLLGFLETAYYPVDRLGPEPRAHLFRDVSALLAAHGDAPVPWRFDLAHVAARRG